MDWLASPFFELRSGERRIAALMVANYFLILLACYLLKPARDALFLVNLEPDRLPWVYMMTAVAATPVAAAYIKAGLRERLDRIILVANLFLIAGLFVLAWLLGLERAWVYYAFYVWTGVATGLLASQFWLLANAVFDPAQAKRIFPLLGVGGIAGAFIGGELTSLLLDRLGASPPDLLLTAGAALALSTLCCQVAWRWRIPEAAPQPEAQIQADRPERSCGALAAVKQSSHLKVTVALVAVTVLATSFVDFQFKTVSWQSYAEAADLTSFLGRFYGRTSLLSLGVQLFLASRLIRRLGVGRTLAVLPTVLAAGAAAMFLSPGLVAGMLMSGGELTLKYSLDRTSRELLFVPVPMALKQRTKIFTDVIVERGARGLAGGLLLAVGALGFGMRQLAVITLVMLVVWMLFVILVKREYVESFRRSLVRREISPDALRVRIDDSAAIKLLVQALSSFREQEVVYALRMLRGVVAPGLAKAVRPLVTHSSARVRRLALEVLRDNGDESDQPAVETRLGDDDLRVRLAALAFLEKHGSTRGKSGEFLAQMIAGAPRCRNAAIAFIAAEPARERYRILVGRPVAELILNETGETGVEGREILAGLDWVPAGCRGGLWTALLADEREPVVRAAMQGIGRRQETERTGWLLEQLQRATLRRAARHALARLATEDESVLEPLWEYFENPVIPAVLRAEIPRTLARIPRRECVDLLLSHLTRPEIGFRAEVLTALARLRALDKELVFDRDRVSRQVEVEAIRYLQLDRCRPLLPSRSEGATMLGRALVEAREFRLESVFRLLGLMYPAKDLMNAHRGVTSRRRLARANAREFLDGLLADKERLMIRLLLDGGGSDLKLRIAGIDPGTRFPDTAAVLDHLSASRDPWLASCAAYCGGEAENPAAARFLERKDDEVLTPIEKALILQKSDFFAGISSNQLGALAEIARPVALLAGDDLFRESDPSEAVFVIVEGRFRLHRSGKELREAVPGEDLGAMNLFDDAPMYMTATATENSTLLRIDREDFEDLLADDVNIVKGILRNVFRFLMDAYDEDTGMIDPRFNRKPKE